jgi:hypothetical protein
MFSCYFLLLTVQTSYLPYVGAVTLMPVLQSLVIQHLIKPLSRFTVAPVCNFIMTNVMLKLLIYLSIYFCLTCFGLSFSPSSEAGVQLR